jgi:hypothetical protein
MTTAHQDERNGKASQRSPKAERKRKKPAPPQSPKLGQQDEDRIDSIVAPADAPVAPADTPVAPADALATEATTPVNAALIDNVALIDEVVAADVASTPSDVATPVATVPASNDPVSIQTIANVCRDYTRKSFLESGSLVEKLMDARSFDKAIEVQTEFVRQAQANFVAQAQRIYELYCELTKQSLKPWSGFAAKANETGR